MFYTWKLVPLFLWIDLFLLHTLHCFKLKFQVRVHCFYHLVPLGRQAQFWLNGDNQEPDPEIGRLSRDLTSIDEALASFLQPRKHRVR